MPWCSRHFFCYFFEFLHFQKNKFDILNKMLYIYCWGGVN